MSDRLETWTPREWPPAIELTGRFVSLRPTDVDVDAAQLHAITREGDPNLWTYLPYGPFADETGFRVWLGRHVGDPALEPRTIVDRATGEAVGNASFMSIEPAHGDIEVGHIFFSARLQRTRAATEAIGLMLRHAFDDLGYRRMVWKCDAANARSVRAAERFGFTAEGLFRQHKIVKGRNRDTAWFAIMDHEWPRLRDAFDRWLDDANVDADGRQIRTLEQVRGEG